MKVVLFEDKDGRVYPALVTRVGPPDVEGGKPVLSLAYVDEDGTTDLHGAIVNRLSGVSHASEVPEVPAPDTPEALTFEPRASWKELRSVGQIPKDEEA